MSLAGLRLWVTRPRQQADALIALLKDAGAEVAALPLLEIAPAENPAPLDNIHRLYAIMTLLLCGCGRSGNDPLC